ncbi:maltodextrin glucosidase [Salmonella enterica subsp. enterica serovar Typhimurium]|nr:maltodextrin glucosidase [Salmonella enterica subsp. enterica serovar Typhimurium]
MSYICWRGGRARHNLQHVAGITRAAKEAQPEAYIVGEHFGDARQWLQADAEDAAMNYRGFTFPLWGFLANTDIAYEPQHIDARTCIAWMDNYRAGLSHQQQLRMFNQLDSHDTARFKTLLGKDAARLPLAVVWLFTWPACHVFITAMKSAWTAQMTPCAANRSHGMNASRTATCWRCTSVWRNCARAVWRCVVADARRCMPKVT